ncbi:MAG TPA: sugar-transfer associated ATP-grasp domain-containing protein [Vicinamibacterales bacterium]|nr:sugar-transfer associated ATP-grasp domain-containing protein [Vicinamibacterales bacterium]
MASTARRLSGRGISSQALAILYLRFSEARLRMYEYYENNLYDARNLSLRGQSTFIGQRKEKVIHDRLNDREWRVFSADKIVFYTFLKGLGLPFPPLYGIYHPGGRFIGDVPSFADRGALGDFLRKTVAYPFFSKPAHGGYGAGALLVEAYNAESDTLRLADGQETSVDEYTRQLEAHSIYGHLFQQPVTPHPRAAEICSNKLASLRLNMLTGTQGPYVFRAFWAVPVGNNMVSNFGTGSNGNLLCALDTKTGVVERAIQGPWHERREISVHPVSGRPIKGFRLPDWEQAVAIATHAARALPRLLSTHWDVALTPQGPMLLEVNFENVFRGPQIAFGRGSFDRDLRGVLANNRVEQR